jgi:hypothetical protein
MKKRNTALLPLQPKLYCVLILSRILPVDLNESINLKGLVFTMYVFEF